MGLNSPILAAWALRLEREGSDLDFSESEDRAAFRARVAAAMKYVKRDILVDLASHWGRAIPGNISHERAVRAVADAWMNHQ